MAHADRGPMGTASLAQLASHRTQWDSFSNTRWTAPEEGYLSLFPGCHMPMYLHTHEWTHKHGGQITRNYRIGIWSSFLHLSFTRFVVYLVGHFVLDRHLRSVSGLSWLSTLLFLTKSLWLSSLLPLLSLTYQVFSLSCPHFSVEAWFLSTSFYATAVGVRMFLVTDGGCAPSFGSVIIFSALLLRPSLNMWLFFVQLILLEKK